MTPREVATRALTFEAPPRIPRSLWALPSAYLRHGERLVELLQRYPLDINPRPPQIPHLGPEHRKGTYTDEWGSTWLNLQDGMAGEVKEPAIRQWSDLDALAPPPVWSEAETAAFEARLRRAPDAFHYLVGGALFERMQYLRGTENLYMDLAEQPAELFRLRDMLMDWLCRRVDECLKHPCDAVHFADDWGSQRSLLVSPKMWRDLFKPCYKELFERVRSAGRFVFMHSDGHILEIIEDLIEVGVNALNCQVWTMGPEALGERYRGRIAFWGELSRQNTVPHGTPQEIRDAIETMKARLSAPAGGLIAQSEVDGLTPLENIEAILQWW